MPSMTLQYRAPENSKDFENLMVVLFEDIYKATFNKYGTNGQKQYGADILGEINKKNIVLQCKCFDQSNTKSKLTKTKILDMVKLIDEKYPNKCHEFFILHTLPNDSYLTDFVAQLNIQREISLAKITLFGWGDINDRINISPRTQKLLQIEQSSESFNNKYFIFAMFLILISIGTYYLYDIYQLNKTKQIQRAQITQVYLKAISENVDLLKQVYISCKESASDYLFLNSDQLQQQCVEPISKQAENLAKLQNKYAASVDNQAYDQIKVFIDTLDKLAIDTYTAAQMTRYLEKDLAQNLQLACYNKGTENNNDFIAKQIKEAFNFQMYAYFKNRDFNIPITNSIRAQITIISRNMNSDALPVDLIKTANQLQSLINKRNHYEYRDYPSNISQVKNVTTNNATFQNGFLTSNNEMIAIYQMSLLVGIKKNPKILDKLIQCGHMRPEAKIHFANEKGTNFTLPLGNDKI
ncbi:hypothetical protein [Acinetobacter seifertii]|uniref:hypothetical protein n=1 Tax=Acinetobacter seifertii TaxID=1530123 RepID=UPI00124F0D63|nr:hypothetical protein [Acinetobacter seifertii]